jgi:SAM-dependent methyltransferase
MIEFQGPNAEQIRYWNEDAGPKWVRLMASISTQIRPLGLLAMERAALREGERVLDVGCGLGETTLEIGRRVGPKGAVVGVDISATMLEHAQAAAVEAGLSHVTFKNADAQTEALPEGAFDVLYSRFGVMFFADPQAAFANLRRGLRSGGRVSFVCWRALAENPWMQIPAMATMAHVPTKRPDPHAPGPFAFADPARLQGILEGAGFGDVHLQKHDEMLSVMPGQPLDAAVEFLVQMGPSGRALQEANAGPELVAKVVASMREALAPHTGPEGVRMMGAVWLVTATAP